MNPVDAQAIWRTCQAVVFDVDSTLSRDEGIDVLAAVAGQGEAIAALTRGAMGGTMTFQESIRRRLELLRPSRQLVEECLRRHPPRPTPHAAELLLALRARGVSVHVASGGFLPLILPLAQALGLTADRIHANDLHFHADGSYAGFTADAPTARSGGKGAVVAALKRTHGYQAVAMVGDGATDLEARPPADLFVGYGGVVERPAVKAGADWFITDFRELIMALEPPQTVIHVVARARVRPDAVAQAQALLVALAGPSRAEPGCLEYTPLAAENDPTLIITQERWRDQAAMQGHLASRHVQQFLVAVAPLLAEAPDIRVMRALA